MLKRIIRKLRKLFINRKQKEDNSEKPGKIILFDQEFNFHHKRAFEDTYSEIFKKGIYTFKEKNEKPLIIDCGANMGVSVLFFSRNYPKSEIIAFEPDESVLPYLEKNIENYQLNNVRLFKKAVWIKEEIIEFYTDKGMGGSVVNDYNHNQVPTKINAIRLKDFLQNKHVDLLKMDIEGSEYLVLKDCETILPQIDNIFIEYHSFENEEQKLDDLLSLLKKSGFRYHLSQSFSRNKPFVDKNIICDKMDLAINIFAYK